MISGLFGGLPFKKEAKQAEMTIREQLTSLPGINNINKKQKKGIDGTFEYLPSIITQKPKMFHMDIFWNCEWVM